MGRADDRIPGGTRPTFSVPVLAGDEDWHTEKQVLRKFPSRFIGRRLYTEPTTRRVVVFTSFDGSAYRCAYLKRSGEFSLSWSRTDCPLVWADPRKPVPRSDTVRVAMSNNCIAWHIARFQSQGRFAGFDVGPKITLGHLVFPPEATEPEYPHELGFVASPAMLDRMSRELTAHIRRTEARSEE